MIWPPLPRIEERGSVCSSEISKVRVGNVVCITYGGADISFLCSSIQILTSAKVFSPSNSPLKTLESGNRTATFVCPPTPTGFGAGLCGLVGVVGVDVLFLCCWCLRSSLSFSISWRILALSSFFWALSLAVWEMYFWRSGSVDSACLAAANRSRSFSSLSTYISQSLFNEP